MAQQVDVAGGSYRARHRERRRREFLDAALAIVLDEGLSRLTMQRVTDDLECSAGSIYQYFPTKGALIAGLQEEALRALAGSMAASQAEVARALHEAGALPAEAALTRALAAARFWVGAARVLPREVELIRLMFIAEDEVVAPDDVGEALPSGLGLVGLGGALLDEAVAAGALVPGDSFARTVTVLAGTTGVSLSEGLARWERRLVGSAQLAEQLVGDLFTAWAVDRGALARAEDLLRSLDAEGRLVPAPPTSAPPVLDVEADSGS